MENVLEAVAKDIVDAALKVHKELVRGCLNQRINNVTHANCVNVAEMF